MTPDTVHLLAQWIRHHRGMATTLEGWLRRQPDSQTVTELREMVGAFRGVLATYESQLSAVITHGSEAEQPTRSAAGRLSSPRFTRVK